MRMLSISSSSRLHIVTDAVAWRHYTKEDIKNIIADIKVGPNPGAHKIKINESIDYMNSLVDTLSKYDPVVHSSSEGTIPGSEGCELDMKMRSITYEVLKSDNL